MSGHGYVGSGTGIRSIKPIDNLRPRWKKDKYELREWYNNRSDQLFSKIADVVHSCSLLHAMHTRSQLVVALNMCG